MKPASEATQNPRRIFPATRAYQRFSRNRAIASANCSTGPCRRSLASPPSLPQTAPRPAPLLERLLVASILFPSLGRASDQSVPLGRALRKRAADVAVDTAAETLSRIAWQPPVTLGPLETIALHVKPRT